MDSRTSDRQFIIFQVEMHSDVITPDEITSALGMQPASSHLRGAVDASVPYPAASHSWVWASDSITTSVEPRDHVQEAMRAFAGKLDLIQSLRHAGVEMTVAIFIRPQKSLLLTPSELRTIAEVGAMEVIPLY